MRTAFYAEAARMAPKMKKAGRISRCQNAIFYSQHYIKEGLLGRAIPIAMLIAALVMAIIMAVVAEVASQFSDPGGPYLYVRTALGPFLGVQVGWFWLLSIISTAAA